MENNVNGAPDSGVDTECDLESNDSSISSASIGGPINIGNLANQPVPPLPAVNGALDETREHNDGQEAGEINDVAQPIPGPSTQPETDEGTPGPSSYNFPIPSTSQNRSNLLYKLPNFSTATTLSNGLSNGEHSSTAYPNGLANSLPLTPPPNAMIPPPSVTEDGYLGDCSSDGGNEKNFPMPADKLSRLLMNSRRVDMVTSSSHHHHHHHHHQKLSRIPESDTIEPPAGIPFSNIQQQQHDYRSHMGYQVRGVRNGLEEGGRKMRSSLLRNRLHHHYHGASPTSHHWMKFSIANRKLRIAANNNNIEAVERLLRNGANPNDMDDHQRTALHCAAAKGFTEVVRLLLSNGADPNQKDTLGNTALHLAACTNHVGVVTLLLRSGTNVTELDNHGRTPMQLAQSKLKLLQKTRTSASEMSTVKQEVSQVLEMMREYFLKRGHGRNKAYNDLLDSFSERLTLHQTCHDLNTDLQDLLDSLSNLQF